MRTSDEPISYNLGSNKILKGGLSPKRGEIATSFSKCWILFLVIFGQVKNFGGGPPKKGGNAPLNFLNPKISKSGYGTP